jgi:phosphoglycolate phosphatase
MSWLVFDLDGTLSDPSIGIYRSINHALERFSHPPLNQARINDFIGPPIDQGFRVLVPDADDSHVRDLVGVFRERYSELGYAENTLYPDIDEMLTHLRARGHRLGLCTSKRVDFATRIVDLFDIREHFSFINGGDVGIHKTDQLADLSRQHNLAQAHMIGDRAIDIEAAHANGLVGTGVLWGFGDLKELQSAGARSVLESPTDLAQAFPAPN